MKVALFVPCYIDQFYPSVAVATLQLLERFGCDVYFPLGQTCCGQPMANSGFASLTHGCNELKSMVTREGLLDGVNVSNAWSTTEKLTLRSIPYLVSGDTLRALF